MRSLGAFTFLAAVSVASAALAVDRMVEGFPDLPADARAVAERSLACQHFGGEVNGTGDERDQQVAATLKELKCDEVEKDLQEMREKYRQRPDLLKILDEAEAI